jgi:hypothetical protein
VAIFDDAILFGVGSRRRSASQQVLVYLGYLAGVETLAETIAERSFAHFARGLMDEEISPTLAARGVGDVTSYKHMLFERFRNPSLRHDSFCVEWREFYHNMVEGRPPKTSVADAREDLVIFRDMIALM